MSFSDNFLPASNTISNITRSNPGVVTTATPHGYATGLFVRLVLNGNFGMQQVNNQTYKIIVLTPTTFSIDANTSNFDSFALGSNKQVPQVIPVGTIALSILDPEENAGNIIPET